MTLGLPVQEYRDIWHKELWTMWGGPWPQEMAATAVPRVRKHHHHLSLPLAQGPLVAALANPHLGCPGPSGKPSQTQDGFGQW